MLWQAAAAAWRAPATDSRVGCSAPSGHIDALLETTVTCMVSGAMPEQLAVGLWSKMYVPVSSGALSTQHQIMTLGGSCAGTGPNQILRTDRLTTAVVAAKAPRLATLLLVAVVVCS